MNSQIARIINIKRNIHVRLYQMSNCTNSNNNHGESNDYPTYLLKQNTLQKELKFIDKIINYIRPELKDSTSSELSSQIDRQLSPFNDDVEFKYFPDEYSFWFELSDIRSKFEGLLYGVSGKSLYIDPSRE